MRAVDPPTAVDLDELEALKSRILYFERLASHFFSFMWLACLLLLAATVAIVVDALLADFKRGALTSDTIYQSASLVLLTAVFLAGVLAATLAYARSVNSAQSRSVRTARKLAALAVLLIVLVFGYLIDWDGAQAALFWRQFRAFFMAPLAHSTAVAEIVLLVGATLVPQYYYHVSHHTLMRLTGEQAFVLRENPDQAFATRLFRTAVGIPRIVDYMPTRRGRATLLFMLANACYALSTAFFMVGTIILLVHLVTVQESCNGGADARCVAESGVLFLSWSVLSCLAAFVVAPLIGARIIAAARKAVRLSVNELLERDDRAPLLFLRPFRDDQVRLKPAKVNVLARIGQWLSSLSTLDELVLEECTPYGPVVAIGNPSDRYPPYGAARGYFDDKTWKQAVLDLAARSRAIIICVDDYEGVWWEVENVVSAYPDKTLLLIPPHCSAAQGNLDILRGVQQHLSATAENQSLHSGLAGVLAPRDAARPSILGLFQSQENAMTCTTSSTFSQLAYLIAVRIFLRRTWGLAARASPTASPTSTGAIGSRF